MTQQTAPFVEGKFGWDYGESFWNLGMDENLVKFSFLFDRNIDGIVSTLPALVNGEAYFLTTDNRLHFAVNSTWYSSPVPKWFTVVMRATGELYQFTGETLSAIANSVDLESQLDAIQVIVDSLGTAAFRPEGYFATKTALDTAVANGQTNLQAAVAGITKTSIGLGNVDNTSDLNKPVSTAQRASLPAYVTINNDIRALSKTTGPKFAHMLGIGTYFLDMSDTTSVDTNGMIIVAGDGGRWKLLDHNKSSNQYYEEFGAVNHRYADRVFIGNAVTNNGRNDQQQQDWLTQYQITAGRSNGFIQSSQASITTSTAPDASNALIVGARTSTLYDNYNAIGIVGIAFADKTTGNGYSYGGYFEAYRGLGVSGGAYGAEIDTINYSSFLAINPYIQLAGQTIGLQMASGGEYSSAGQFDASVAHNIQNNGAKFGIGINFGATSITGTDGLTGTGIAIAFGRGHLQQWYSATGKTSSILGNCLTPALSLNQVFVDNQIQFQNQAAKNVFRVLAPANSVNYIDVRSAVAGAAASINASGDDTNIDVAIVPKGAGLFQYGVYTAGAPTPTGYFTMRTTAGQVLRVACQLV